MSRAGKLLLVALAAGCATEPEPDLATIRSNITNPTQGPDYRLFESGQVRPLALSADRKIARAAAGECDLVVKRRGLRRERGFLYKNGLFYPDHAYGVPRTDNVLRLASQLPGLETTHTCVPPGSGKRIAIDRVLDGDEFGVWDDDD